MPKLIKWLHVVDSILFFDTALPELPPSDKPVASVVHVADKYLKFEIPWTGKYEQVSTDDSPKTKGKSLSKKVGKAMKARLEAERQLANQRLVQNLAMIPSTDLVS